MLGTTDYCETKLKLSRLAGENENALTIKTRHFVAGKSSVQTMHLFTPARLFTAGFARGITVAVDRKTSDVIFAYYQCETGKGGTCSHSFALMKTLARWSLDQLKEIPEDIACTSTLVCGQCHNHERGSLRPLYLN